MKVAITAQGEDLASPVDSRFGRARSFIVVDTQSGEFSAHDNAQNVGAAQGAGIQAARTVADLGAEAVVTGNVGPKAFAALEAADVKIYLGASGTVQESLDKFQAGKLAEAGKANVEGHWG